MIRLVSFRHEKSTAKRQQQLEEEDENKQKHLFNLDQKEILFFQNKQRK